MSRCPSIRNSEHLRRGHEPTHPRIHACTHYSNAKPTHLGNGLVHPSDRSRFTVVHNIYIIRTLPGATCAHHAGHIDPTQVNVPLSYDPTEPTQKSMWKGSRPCSRRWVISTPGSADLPSCCLLLRPCAAAKPQELLPPTIVMITLCFSFTGLCAYESEASVHRSPISNREEMSCRM